MEHFGQRVIDLRDKHGWTRRELAKRSGLHEQHLLKIEQGCVSVLRVTPLSASHVRLHSARIISSDSKRKQTTSPTLLHP
jgi:DNA-binding XRE family transcriptional regulator